MDRVFRIDHGQLKAPVETSQGFLRVEGYVGRAGIYEYVNTEQDVKAGHGPLGGVRRELRPEEEVFREDVLAGFEGATLTATHPKQIVSTKNVRTYEVGTSTKGFRDGNRVAAAMVITDPKTIERVRKHELVELSPGYTAMVHKTPGVDKRYATPSNPEGRYDCVQRDIVINHLALVPRARGGSDLCVRMDGADLAVSEERRDEATLLTTSTDGHQHTICIYGDSSGRTSWATSKSAANSDDPDATHSHSWIRNADGSLTIGEDSGHTHEVEAAAVPTDPVAVALAVVGEQIDAMVSGRNDSAQTEGTNMDKDEQIRLLKAQLVDAQKASEQRRDSLDTTTADRDRAQAKIKTLEERVADLESRLSAGASAMETQAIAAQATRADAAELELTKLKVSREAEIRRAAVVRAKALLVMGPEFRVDDLDDRTIQATVIKKFAPKEVITAETSPAYVAQRFDSLIDDRQRTARSHTSIGEVLAGHLPNREARTDARDTRESRAKAWREQALTGSTAQARQKDE